MAAVSFFLYSSPEHPVRLPRCPALAFFALLLLLASLTRAESDPRLALWRERVKSVVAVEFYIESEIERRPTIAGGTVIDREGTIILHGSAIPIHIPPSQLKDLRVYLPGQPVSHHATAQYLGPDTASGWHFIRVEEALRGSLVPVTEFVGGGSDAVTAEITQEVWGIGLRGKEEEFEPYFLSNRVALLTRLPHLTGIALGNVTAPQLPVFDQAGRLVGLGLAGFGETFYQYSRTERGSPLLLVSGDETRVFRLAADVVPFFARIPRSISGRPSPWLGIMGLQALPAEVAKFLKLENQSALVVSEVLEGGPAEAAGVKERDIIVAVDGKPLPRLKPPPVVAGWMEREVALRAPGETLRLSVLRGQERLELSPVLIDEPRMLREADRQYYDRLGFTIREFLFTDAVSNRIPEKERSGVIAHFVKSNSPAAAAGLRAEDWVREIDGVEVKTYAEAVEVLGRIDQDQARREFILLISRGGETSVLRVKLR